MYKLLLIENNFFYRSTLRYALLRKFNNLAVKEVSGDSDLLVQIAEFMPDVIFMGIEFQRDNGKRNLTDEIKSKFVATTVIIHGQQIKEYRDAAEQCGADYFLAKDCSLQQIFDCVNSAMYIKGMILSN